MAYSNPYGSNTAQGQGNANRRRRRNRRRRGRVEQGGSGLGGTPRSSRPAPAQPPPGQQAFGPTPPPPDPRLEAERVSAQRNLGLSDAYATFNQGELDQSYGFGPGGAANPYSQAALLQESFTRSQRGTTNQMASQGQLYSGAYGRAQNENQRNYDIGYDQLRRDYDRDTAEIGFGRAQSYADYGAGVDNATFEAIMRALTRGR